jgi:hypothetical protein
MEDLENWAAGQRAQHDGIRWDIDAGRLCLSHERQELLSLRAQLSISPEEVVQLRAFVAILQTQEKAREEDAQKRFAAANERLAASTTHASALEGDLRAATTSLEASGARVAVLEVALGNTQKLLEDAQRGNRPPRPSSSFKHRPRPTPQACARPRRGWPKLWQSYDSSPARSRLVSYQRLLSGKRTR